MGNRVVTGSVQKIAVVAWPIMIGVGYWIGHLFAQGVPQWPPLVASEWMPTVVLPAVLIVGLVCGLHQFAWWFEDAMWVVIIIIAIAILLRPRVPQTLALGHAVAWVVGLGLPVSLFTIVLSRVERRLYGGTIPVVIMMVMVGASACLMMGGYATLVPATLALGGAVVAGSLLSVCFFYTVVSCGLIRICLVLLVGQLVLGKFYAELPLTEMVLLGVALPAISVVLLPVIGQKPYWQIRFWCVLASGIPVLVAVTISGLKYAATAATSYNF